MSARPWFKFWPADWQADPALQGCSVGARGLWLEMLLLMHSGQPRGHLTHPNGKMIDARKLGIMCRVPSSACRELLAELREADVFSLTSEGVIFSRKMCRDEARSLTGKHHGKRGGNPKLLVIEGGGSPLRVGDNPHWNMASPRESLPTYQEEALGEDGPFTEGNAA